MRQVITDLQHIRITIRLLETIVIFNSVLKKGTLHAEIDLFNKLPSLRRSKNLKRIDFTIVQIYGKSDNYRYKNAKPCMHCLNKLSVYSIKKGYRIGNIYFSDDNGTITKSTLNKLLLDKPYISRGSL